MPWHPTPDRNAVADLRALPTEPLLDEPTRGLSRWRTPPEVQRWLDELAGEGDTNARCGLLFQSLRKQFDGPLFVPMGRGILASAVRGESSGVAVLAGFLAVDAPGEMLVERVREFSNVHREAGRYRRALDHGHTLGKAEHALLHELEDIDRQWAERWPEPSAAAKARDRGPAWRCRRAFGSIVAELEATGNLDPGSIDALVRLARLELDALEQRASSLAGAINPYSARHVSHVMPILGAVDTDLRDMRRFVDQLEQSRKVGIFHEQVPAVSEHLDAPDEKRLRERLEQEETLQLLWRVLRGLDRNPLAQRALAYFCDRVLEMGDALRHAGLRDQPLDLLSSVLCVLDLHRDGVLQLPVSAPVGRALAEAKIEGVDVGEGNVRVVLDPAAARRLALPYGLPLPAVEEADRLEQEKKEEETVKDLVMANLNNTSVLLGLLKNQKVVNTPGVVALVVSRSRNMRVLDTVCTMRNLHSGFANKDVPIALLRSPMNIPIKVLRKFVNVRYVSKVELRRLGKDRSAIRREVAEEVDAYLRSLA